MKKHWSLWIGAACVVGCGGMDGPTDTNTNVSESPIIGGTTDYGDPSVVAIFAHPAGSNYGSLCTGTVVSARSILTAAHCVDPRVIGTGNVFEVYQGTNFGSSSTKLAVASTAFDTAFDPSHLERGHDVAIVTLSQPTGLLPVPFNQSPLTNASYSVPVRIVGYGTNSHTNTGAGTKRMVQTAIDSISSLFVQIGSSSQQTCHGDSGGPALQVINGVETIIGVTSFGSDRSSTSVCFGGGYDTRLDAYSSFITGHLAR